MKHIKGKTRLGSFHVTHGSSRSFVSVYRFFLSKVAFAKAPKENHSLGGGVVVEAHQLALSVGNVEADIPDLSRRIKAPRDHPSPIGGKGNGEDPVGVPTQSHDLPSRRGVPYPCGVI